MNAKLKIFKIITTKTLSISHLNLSERVEFTNMIKFIDVLIEN